MKSFIAIAVVALFAVASSNTISNKNLITDIIEGIINNNKDKLANINIPTIDLGDAGIINNLLIVGAENLVIERMDATGPLAVDIKNLTVTLAVASATADIVNCNLQIPEIGLDVTCDAASVSGSASKMFLTIALDLSLNGLKPTLEDFSNLDIIVGGIDATLTGVNNAEETNNIINTKLADFLTGFLPVAANENKAVIIELVNTILDGLTQ